MSWLLLAAMGCSLRATSANLDDAYWLSKPADERFARLWQFRGFELPDNPNADGWLVDDVRAEPNSPGALTRLARWRWWQAEVDQDPVRRFALLQEALSLLSWALLFDGSSLEARTAMGLVLTELGAFTQARVHLLAVVLQHPLHDGGLALATLGRWWLREGSSAQDLRHARWANDVLQSARNRESVTARAFFLTVMLDYRRRDRRALKTSVRYAILSGHCFDPDSPRMEHWWGPVISDAVKRDPVRFPE